MEITFGQLVEYSSKLSVLVVLVIILFGISKKWIVPGWVLTERDERIKKLEERDERWNALLTRLVEPVLPKK